MDNPTLMHSARPRTSPPPLPRATIGALVDHAMTLLLANDTEAALRWAAAAVERDPAASFPLVVTARAMARMGRTRAATDALELATSLAIEARDLPLALAAAHDLRALGVDAQPLIEEIAATFCLGSPRLTGDVEPWPAGPRPSDLQPLNPFLTGPALASRAAEMLQGARQVHAYREPSSRPLAPLPLFSALPRDALRDLMQAFEMITVPTGHPVVEEGGPGDAVYIVVRGELEVSARAGDEPARRAVARLESGAFFGEMAILAELPAGSSVTAITPSILLISRRWAFDAIAEEHPAIRDELVARSWRQTVENLAWTSPVMASLAAGERAALVSRLETRVFESGQRLVEEGGESPGLYLVVVGEVALHARGGVALKTLGAGSLVGEAEALLWRKAESDVVASCRTVTLFLPRESLFALLQTHPAILHGLYASAVRSLDEAGGAVMPSDAWPDVPRASRDWSDGRPAPSARRSSAEVTFPPVASAGVASETLVDVSTTRLPLPRSTHRPSHPRTPAASPAAPRARTRSRSNLEIALALVAAASLVAASFALLQRESSNPPPAAMVASVTTSLGPIARDPTPPSPLTEATELHASAPTTPLANEPPNPRPTRSPAPPRARRAAPVAAPPAPANAAPPPAPTSAPATTSSPDPAKPIVRDDDEFGGRR